jgi:hypothetical protein
MPRDMQPHLYEPTEAYDVDSESPGLASGRGTTRNAEYVRHGTCSSEGWGLEILSTFASFVLLAGITTIFWFMDGKPVSNWWFPISLNAVISILATACTAAIAHNVSAFIGQLKWLYFKMAPRRLYNLERFDAASRGPYGSAVFLLRVRWNLTTVGAFITVCRLALAPLAQQVVDLPSRDIIIPDSTATFGFAHAYNRNLTRTNE